MVMTSSKRRTRPAALAANKGRRGPIRIGSGGKSRRAKAAETVRLAEILAEVIRSYGIAAEVTDPDWVDLPDSGYQLLPLTCMVDPLPDGRIQTVTTIQAHHPEVVPDGIFEYQHSSGRDAYESLHEGFIPWANVDLVTLLEAAAPVPKICSQMILPLPARDGRPARARRALLGPVAHYQSAPLADRPLSATDDPDHIFCPCCFLTHSGDAFAPLLEGEGVFGIRFFGLRNREGYPLADCRVNGADYEPGAVPLRAYASLWPECGYEIRKQYVLIQETVPLSDELIGRLQEGPLPSEVLLSDDVAGAD